MMSLIMTTSTLRIATVSSVTPSTSADSGELVLISVRRVPTPLENLENLNN